MKVAVSLPGSMFREAEKLRKKRGQSRSALFAEALGGLLERAERGEKVRRYVEGYRRYPETEEEIRAAGDSAALLLAEIPWEE